MNKAWRASETLAYELGSGTKTYLQTPKSVEEKGQGTQFWVPHLWLTNSRALGAFLWFMYGQPQRWHKTKRFQRFLNKDEFMHDWQRIVIRGLRPWSHLQVSWWQRKENSFIVGKGSWEGWRKQKVPSFTLAEPLPGKKRSLSPSYWLSCHHRD